MGAWLLPLLWNLDHNALYVWRTRMSSLVVRFSAFCQHLFQGMGWKLCFLSLELALSAIGGGGVTFSPITKFSRRRPSMSPGFIMSPCSFELGTWFSTDALSVLVVPELWLLVRTGTFEGLCQGIWPLGLWPTLNTSWECCSVLSVFLLGEMRLVYERSLGYA